MSSLCVWSLRQRSFESSVFPRKTRLQRWSLPFPKHPPSKLLPQHKQNLQALLSKLKFTCLHGANINTTNSKTRGRNMNMIHASNKTSRLKKEMSFRSGELQQFNSTKWEQRGDIWCCLRKISMHWNGRGSPWCTVIGWLLWLTVVVLLLGFCRTVPGWRCGRRDGSCCVTCASSTTEVSRAYLFTNWFLQRN